MDFFFFPRSLALAHTNPTFPLQNFAAEVSAPDAAAGAKPRVPRCLWAGPAPGHQPLPTDV